MLAIELTDKILTKLFHENIFYQLKTFETSSFLSVQENQVKRHENDATSVDMIVQELEMEPFNPDLVYK